jgi:MFS transporter, YQGE family, putative transporter
MTSEAVSHIKRLEPKAWVVLLISGLYGGADALCGLFVSVYLWVNSQDFGVVCAHYLALYVVTPFFFVLSGWYAQARDRLHVYRLGLAMHAAYYGALLVLRERAPEFAVYLGAFLGMTWGIYYAGANTFNFDMTAQGRREYFFGLLHATVGVFRLLAPPIGGLIIHFVPRDMVGYHVVFGIAVAMYVTCFVLSFQIAPDKTRRPFNIRRALFPPREHRDWRLIMLASATMAGSYSIFAFLLGLLMFMETDNELSVGGFGSFQAIAGITSAYLVGRFITKRTWKRSIQLGVITLFCAGLSVVTHLSVVTLILFGLLRSIAGPLVAVPHVSLRFDTITKTANDPAERIEYICAWEVPLAIGRILMMSAIVALYFGFPDNELGIRLGLMLLCSVRILTYLILSRTTILREA